MKTIAGVVLYNPDVKRLQENIKAIRSQVDKLILVDNGSSDSSYLKALELSEYAYIRNEMNLGIAHALNQILCFSYDEGYEWALTLDQDSIVSANLIETYKEFANKETVGIVCCKTKDRNFKTLHQDELRYDEEVKYCITSASLTNVNAWKKVGGFDDQMFIDWVDWDICIALRHAGYKIIRTEKTYINHELGTRTRMKHIGNHQFLILNRSPFRYYYVFRNWIYIARKWKEESVLIHLLQNIKWLLIIILFESNKWANMKVFVRGTWDGLKMKVKRPVNE